MVAVVVNTRHFASSITNLSASKIGISSCVPVWPPGTCDRICSSRLSWKIFIPQNPFLNSSKQVFTSAVTFLWRSLPADWAHITLIARVYRRAIISLELRTPAAVNLQNIWAISRCSDVNKTESPGGGGKKTRLIINYSPLTNASKSIRHIHYEY